MVTSLPRAFNSTFTSIHVQLFWNCDGQVMASSSYPIDPTSPQQSDSRSKNAQSDHRPPDLHSWNIDHPFEYAPKKPDGDHWELLLEPLLKKDKARCEGWKDEVQNLLIFAGLFSAVVTAFIIESYKGLQRNTDDDIINLLSQITIQLRSPLNSTSIISPNSSLLLSKYTPGSSTIRVNNFWFISLVLSLTTVLIGIISLQWLREHQNYTNLTPMQQYAIFHMRNEGLEKWHVRRIFAAMPLLLQSALVLFFTGMIDFLLAFGHISVAVPVTIVIGFTLIFLIATTLLPTLQELALFFCFSSSGQDKHPPIQCPYKYPQSDAFRTICSPIFNLIRRLHPHIRSLSFDQQQKQTKEDCAQRTFAQQLCRSERTWLAFDLNWLEIRDGFMRRAFHRPLDYFDRLGQDTRLDTHLPIWDILRGFNSHIQPAAVSPLYHAFLDLLNETFSGLRYSHSDYLYDVVATDLNNPDVPLSDIYEDDTRGLTPRALEKYQVMYTFLHKISSQDQEAISLHMAEIQLRLIDYFYASEFPVRAKKQQEVLPFCLRPASRSHSMQKQLVQVSHVTTTLLKTACSTNFNPQNALINVACGRDGLRQCIETFASILTLGSIRSTDHQQTYCSILDLINEKLDQEISNFSISAGPSLFFYIAAIFSYASKRTTHNWLQPPPRPPSFHKLLSTLLRYRNLTIDKGLFDPVIEEQLASYDIWTRDSTFSVRWWSFLNHDIPSSICGDYHEDTSPHKGPPI